MFVNSNVISCNSAAFPSLHHDPKLKTSLQSQQLRPRISFRKTSSSFSAFCKPHNHTSSILAFQKKRLTQICHCILTSQDSEDAVAEKRDSSEAGLGGGGNDGDGRDWATSILLLVLWGALMYYVFNLTPNQTPVLQNHDFCHFYVGAFFGYFL